jgi:hypothetical protein
MKDKSQSRNKNYNLITFVFISKGRYLQFSSAYSQRTPGKQLYFL